MLIPYRSAFAILVSTSTALLAGCAQQLPAVPQMTCSGKPVYGFTIDAKSSNAMAVEASINHEPPVLLEIDTGSGATILDASLISHLSLPNSNEYTRAQMPVGSRTSPFYLVNSLKFGDVDMPVKVLSSPKPEHQISGLIGTDVLKHDDWVFDLPTGHVAAYPLGSCHFPEGSHDPYANIVVFSNDKHVETIVSVDGHDTAAELDTGAMMNVIMRRFVAGNGLLNTSQALGPAKPAHSFDGVEFMTEPRRFGRMWIDGHVVEKPEMDVYDMDPGDPFPIQLGFPFFRQHKVIISYGNDQMQIQ